MAAGNAHSRFDCRNQRAFGAQRRTRRPLTTNGFADVLEIARQNRPHLYDLAPQKIAPLIPAQLRFEVAERIGSEGEIVVPLDENGVREVAHQMRVLGVESVAVVFLWSF